MEAPAAGAFSDFTWQGASRYDIVVVGAGVFGLATAHYLRLAHPNERMLVLDARLAPGEGSTGASAAMVRDVFTSSDNRNLARSTIDFYGSTQAEGIDLGLDLYGYLWMLDRGDLDRYAPHVEDFGPGVARVVAADELRSMPGLSLAPSSASAKLMELPPVAGGILGHKCGAVAPDLVAKFYHDRLVQEGVEFRFGTTVSSLGFDDRTVIDLGEGRPYAWQEHIRDRVQVGTVETSRGERIRTGGVVLAAGGWSTQLLDPLGIDSGARPKVRQLFALESPRLRELLGWRGSLESPYSGTHTCPFLILPTGTYLKPIPGQDTFWAGHADYVGVRFGAEEDLRRGSLEFDPRTLGHIDHYLGHVGPIVSEYLTPFQGLRPHSSWGGYYEMTPDGLPYIFSRNGVLVVVGDGGSGVMKADAVGRIAATVRDGHRFATLHGGTSYDVSRLGYEDRHVESERFVI